MAQIKLGFAPTRRSIFSAPDAIKYRGLTAQRLRELGVDFVDIDDINEEGLLYNEDDRLKIVEKFRAAGVDGLLLAHCNFGTEYLCARLAKDLNVPVLLWGPLDERPEPDGTRLRDTQCGLFATGKVLRRFGVPFTYLTNCRLSDPVFERGVRDFLAVCNVVKTFRNIRILQIGPRPFDFWSTMCNEGELLEKFNIQLAPIPLPELTTEVKKAIAEGDEVQKTIAYCRENMDIKVSDEQLTNIAGLAVAMERLVKQYHCNAAAIQCWNALQGELGIMPCAANAILNERGTPVVCETDIHGAITALQDAGVPILMQAYPDEIGKMDFAHRRDAYCGKFSVTDVFCQYNVPFTVLKPHVVHPLSAKFQENLRDFAAICRVVNGMKRFNLGCIGARTTAFKTVRFDELAMQKNGINVESFDLSEVFEKVRAKADDDAVVLAKLEHLKNYTDFSKVPASNALTLAKVSVVLDEYIEEYHLDALALRCWNEMETYLRVCPCVLLSELNDRGIVASCEIDMCSAISMRAMSLASEGPAAVLDWNNNYGDDEDKIILFHCGPVAQSLMAGKGTVTEHKMFAKNDPGSGWGCNEGRIKPMPITISNCQTKDGKIVIYASEAKFTDDPIEDGYFGCGGVAEIPHLQDKCITLAKGGFKHHTAICEGHYKDILKEAFTTYLGYEWVDIDG